MSTAPTVLAVVREDIEALSEDVADLWQTCCRFAPSVLLNLSTPLKTESSHLHIPFVSLAFYPPTYHREENILCGLGLIETTRFLYTIMFHVLIVIAVTALVVKCEAGSRKSTNLCPCVIYSSVCSRGECVWKEYCIILNSESYRCLLFNSCFYYLRILQV